ncbi:unnamed protein product, partial [Mesorhabditis belari]|uniref:Peroxisomal targeting signal 1 receptor n=1 Tax=Mesorhabditis belari TaxID=2138241 RepID=A0AAF3EWT0_9BILA
MKKGLVEGECGRSNALVGLANQFGTSNQRISSSIQQGTSTLLPSSSQGELFANEFLQQKAQRTAIPRTFHTSSLLPQRPSASKTSALATQWGNEFNTMQTQSLGAQWATQFHETRPMVAMESAWSQATEKQAFQAPQGSSLDSGMWSAEFLDNIDTSLNKTQGDIYSDAWADAEVAHESRMGDMEEAWDEVWNKKQLDALRHQFANSSIETDYTHELSNPFLSEANPSSLGENLLKEGDLGGAILAYEAATQQNPQDAQAWCNLGLSLAENEYDTRAITAFRKCLEIDSGNKEALLGISVSLANESLENDALEHLEKWVVAHTGGDPKTVSRPAPTYSSFLDHHVFGQVEEKFLDVARRQEGAGDADLQNALGVLYNLNRNFERATECLKLAVSHKPQVCR